MTDHERSPTTPPAATEADGASRRRFLQAGAAGSLAGGLLVHSSVAAAEANRPLRLGIIGCGGRGTGAVHDSLTINQNVTLVAAADLYVEKCAALRKTVAAAHPDKIDLADASMHGGLDGARRVFDDPRVDVVLIASSPGFHPAHVREAVAARKHVFVEKPSCVDPVGYRICQAAHAAAAAQGTAIVTGTQYRRQVNYIAAVERIRQGAIGDVVGATTRYCTSGIWYRPRKEGMSDAEYQLNNWYHFVWLSGDQICEQAVHNIDVMNWVMDANPVAAVGSGGRFTRPQDSELWDGMAVDFEYPGERIVSFTCRQIPGTESDNGSVVYGSRGTCHIGSSNDPCTIFDRSGKKMWEMSGRISDAYRQEHKDLVDSIRADAPIVELAPMADSSLAAVMGRLAAYTGRRVTWDFVADESRLDLFPESLAWESALPARSFAVPGRTKLV
jgi:myo-inositol 2-dehydrogenase/D-chiro-inositol 1-dehydrogenase